MICAVLLSTTASAHYLWVIVEPSETGNDTAKMYFEHSAVPGDGHYLDHFTTGSQMWLQSPMLSKARKLTLTEAKTEKHRWLETKIDQPTPRSVDMYGKFGVYFYKKKPVLLHYYGRFLDVNSTEEINTLSQAPHLNLDVSPEWNEGEMTLTVRWQGKPATESEVVLFGPQKFRETVKTDSKGQVRFKLSVSGRYFVRSSVEFQTAGTDDDGQDYKAIRHTGTLVFDLPEAK
jgi:hypothetical protein